MECVLAGRQRRREVIALIRMFDNFFLLDLLAFHSITFANIDKFSIFSVFFHMHTRDVEKIRTEKRKYNNNNNNILFIKRCFVIMRIKISQNAVVAVLTVRIDKTHAIDLRAQISLLVGLGAERKFPLACGWIVFNRCYDKRRKSLKWNARDEMQHCIARECILEILFCN